MKSNLVGRCGRLMHGFVRGMRQFRSLPSVWLFAAAALLAMPATGQTQSTVGAKFPIANGWAGVTAASGGGNFIVALEGDTVAAKVAAQLVSSSGTQIGSPVALGHDGQSCCASGAAFDGTNYLLAWEEDQGIKNSWEPFKVYGQFISATGTTVGQAFAMTSTGITFDGMNMLAYGGGKYLLTYTRLIVPANGDRQDNRYVAGRIVSPDGTMGSEFRISQGLGNGSSVTFNGENFFVVWKEDSLDYEVRGRFVSPAGVPLGEISINASLAPSDNPVAASFDGTNYMVVWSDENTTGWDVFAQRVSVADGSLVGGVIAVNSETGSQMATSITFDGSNHLVTWIDMANDANGNGVCDANEGSCWDVYGQYIGKDGALVGGKFAINTDPGNHIGGVGCADGKCIALVSSDIVMGKGGPAQVGDVFGAFLSVGTGPHNANGTYTWTSATGVLALNFTSSDFMCDGPSLGGSTDTGVVITATAMTMASDRNMIWTRPNGTPGDVVGTWIGTDSSTGNAYTLTFSSNGTMAVTAVIVSCGSGGSGGASAKAESQHWSDGYHVQLRYSDPGKAASAVSVTGTGITGSVALTYNANMGSWGSGTPESRLFFGTTYPAGLPFNYIFTITDTSTWTASSTVSCFQQQFATNLSPVGALAVNPTFSWTDIGDASAIYGVQVNDSSGKWLWANYAVSGTSVAYSGPALTPGMTYGYVVSVQSSSACADPTSGGGSHVAASFTYGTSGGADTTAPTVPGGVAVVADGANQVNVSWNISTDNVGVTYYQVYRNGSAAGTPAGANNIFWPDNQVTAGTTYAYTVAACDAAGNCSAQSSAVSVTTQSGTGASQFDGDYAGSWSKSCPSCGITASVGTFTATLANGVFSNIQFNLTSGDSGIRFDSGATSSSGVLIGTGATPSQCSSSVSTFAGQITTTSSGGAEMAMTYSRPASNTCAAESGTITATRSSSSTTSASLIPGWNLLGNGLSNAINVTAVFGNTSLVTTVWKWIASSGVWAFYTPALGDGGAAYAVSKGYLPLTTINGGEGFWVNAKGTFSAQLLGNAVPTAGFADSVVSNGLPAGWSLIAIGDDKTPRAFVNAIALIPPAAGTLVATSLTTLWAWDASLSGWYFYAPSLVNLGTQAAYISAKGYLDFTTAGKTLSPSTGFWVNHP